MRPDDVTALLREEPFRRFRIVLNSGRTYEVRHPEMIQVLRTVVYVFGGAVGDDDPPRYEVVSLVLIERLEVLVR
jgi:hypothetical protein